MQCSAVECRRKREEIGSRNRNRNRMEWTAYWTKKEKVEREREGQFGLRISVKGTRHEGNNKCEEG